MKKLPRWVLLLLVLLIVTTRLPAQNESLLIGAGDLLRLQVYDTPEMEQRARSRMRGPFLSVFWVA